MALEPVFEKEVLAGFKRLCVKQTVVEARLLSASEATIAKVLAVAADCQVNLGEVFAGEARYSGRVGFKAIFVDSEGKNGCMDYSADFTDKLLDEKIRAGSKPMISAHVLDTDIVEVTAASLMLACVVETALDAVTEEEVSALTAGGEGIYTHDVRTEFSRLVGETSASFTVQDEIKDLKAGKVLLSEAKAVLSKRSVLGERVALEGEVHCTLTCEDAEGMIFQVQKATQFFEEIGLAGAREGQFAVAALCLNSHSVTIETDGEKSAALLEFNLSAYIKCFGDDVFHPVVDAFSVSNELKTDRTAVEIFKGKFSGTATERVEGSVTLDINMPIADTVLAVTGSKLNIASAAAGADAINLDGTASASIIYFSAEANVTASVAVELPFSLSVPVVGAVPGDGASAKGMVTHWAVKILRGNVLQIKADIALEVLVSGLETRSVLTGLSIGEARELSSAAYSVYIASPGESLWDVSKALGITPEIVLTQNPGLVLPLSGGERVLGYRQVRR